MPLIGKQQTASWVTEHGFHAVSRVHRVTAAEGNDAVAVAGTEHG